MWWYPGECEVPGVEGTGGGVGSPGWRVSGVCEIGRERRVEGRIWQNDTYGAMR